MYVRKIVSVGIVLICYKFNCFISGAINEENNNNVDLDLTDELKNMLGKTLNFSFLEKNTNGVQLTLLKKPVDFSALQVDKETAKQLNKMLRGRKVSEFFYVASHLAGIESKIAQKSGEKITTLPLESIFSPDEDTVYGADDVDLILREITLNPNTLDLTHKSSLSGQSRTKRKAISYDSYRWPTTIPYVISDDFNNDARTVEVIKRGIKNWEEETCLTFQQVTDYKGPHLIFKKMQGCWSKVGMQYGDFGQYISIGPGCEAAGIVAHEVGHALGFHHEHQRPDRDRYVTINYENILSGRSSNFLSRQWQHDLTEGVPYDYSSIMQYVLSSFTRNGQNTISLNEEDMNTLAGSQYILSYFDVKLANIMYCTERCNGGLAWDACQNGGYRDPNDCTRCRCPDGLAGQYCTEVQPGVNANCGTTEFEPTPTWTAMTSPNYDTQGGLPAFSKCTWRIRTNEENARIVVRFRDSFRLPCNAYVGACESYIEIRRKHMAKSGPRYCCNDNIQKEFVSHGKEVLLLLRSTSNQYARGFKLEYRLEACGCSSNASVSSVPACLKTETYSCPGTYQECSYQGCREGRRENTCYRETKSCCGNFELNGDSCSARLSAWSDWSTCSKTCDSGTQTRTRTCLRPPCSEPQSESQSCNGISCNAVDLWSNWNSWTTCSATCGSGSRTRNRNCLSQTCSTGLNYENESCNLKSCDGGWSNWFNWSGCSGSCGSGFRIRNRVCSSPPCSGTSYQTEICNNVDCPGVWSNWNSWSSCSVTCGPGTKSRTRNCPNPPCSGSETAVGSCYESACPVSGVWSNWNSWSSCSVTCGPGTRSRTRTCPSPPCSGSSTFEDSCFVSICPGQWASWYAWSSCSATCGSGSRTRTRSCYWNPCSGDRSETDVCNTNTCPGEWNSWNPWSDCSQTCGSGSRNRDRTCRNPPCSGSSSESQNCNTQTCPSNIWSNWSNWSTCSKTCESGSRTRSRTCVSSPCSGPATEVEDCNTETCPGTSSSTSWSAWNQWSQCSSSCGPGHKLRFRSCRQQPCSGLGYEVVLCNEQDCPSSWSQWSQWSTCSESCGSGTRTRSRSCSGSNCSGSAGELQNCNTDPCTARTWCTKKVRCVDYYGRIGYCTRYYTC